MSQRNQCHVMLYKYFFVFVFCIVPSVLVLLCDCLSLNVAVVTK